MYAFLCADDHEYVQFDVTYRTLFDFMSVTLHLNGVFMYILFDLVVCYLFTGMLANPKKTTPTRQ